MTMRGVGGVGAVLLAAGLVVSGCGGGDKGDESAAGGGALKSDCSVAYSTATAVAGQLVSYRSMGDASKLPVSGSAISGATLPLIKDAKVRKIADEGQANAKAFNDALAKNDATARDKAIVAAKPIFARYKDACSGAVEEETKKAFGILDEALAPGTLPKPLGGAAAPSVSIPTSVAPSSKAKPKLPTVTKKGATVKVGQPVVFVMEKDGKKTYIELKVTSIDKASDDDLKGVRKDSLKDTKAVYFVRAEGKEIHPEGIEWDMNAPSIHSLYPEFEIATADGTQWTKMIMIGDFEPCEDKDDDLVRKFCTPFAIGSGSTDVRVAGLTGIETGKTDSKDPLYIWTK
ncbi:hypothetical protein GOEFS_110_00270 [Gordonia effusa NBRC 100432]|uniref:Lipoprotein n=1 Tax=Gordonia effusa NBRC 100432 TaxID=1077974 RepID=H0R5E8_9ACTN|nr:hypothetical protein [Gordonia effusa]GAB20299.1 hypothetical protein GOEFS_110_00270 [Gordonia effusa NBRC 100432]